MINTNITKKIFLSLALVGVFSFNYAQATAINTTIPKSPATLSEVITKSDNAIKARITKLNELSARVDKMKNVSLADKNSIKNEIQKNIASLTALKAKIDADKDITTAKNDAKTITENYRIYALIVPQGYIVASSDRISTIASMLEAVQSKLQSRADAAEKAGKDVKAIKTVLDEMTAKLSDAIAKAKKAQTEVSTLVPDQGNTVTAASNKATLLTAKEDIKTATADIQVARKDVHTIFLKLKALKS